MLIIIEGPDGAGKTTLVGQLCVQDTYHHDLPVVPPIVLHARPPKRHPLDEYVVPLASYPVAWGRTIICDRWHVGETVYPAVLGRDTQYDVAVRRYVDLFLRSRGALIVMLNPPLPVLVDRVSSRGDDLVRPNQLGRVRAGYDSFYSEVLCLRYSTTQTQPGLITELARTEEYDVALLRPYTTYVGPRQPRILLMGQHRGVEARLAYGPLPAFMPYPATSGHYLLSHLDPGGSVGLANACDVDDPKGLWHALGEPRVVALGQAADAGLTDAGVPHGVAPHPQFVRRFHHSHGAEYARVVMTAAEDQEDLSPWRP
jgi:hypothetical protein